MKAVLSLAVFLATIVVSSTPVSGDTVCPPTSTVFSGELISIEEDPGSLWGEEAYEAQLENNGNVVTFGLLGRFDLLFVGESYEATIYSFGPITESSGLVTLGATGTCQEASSIRAIGPDGVQDIEIPPSLIERIESSYRPLLIGFAGFTVLIFVFGRERGT